MKHLSSVAFDGLHTNNICLDVGNDSIFDPSNPWMKKKGESSSTSS